MICSYFILILIIYFILSNLNKYLCKNHILTAIRCFYEFTLFNNFNFVPLIRCQTNFTPFKLFKVILKFKENGIINSTKDLIENLNSSID